MKRLNRFKKILFWQTRETAAMSHISKLETMQDKILRTTVNAPWYVRNEDVRKWRARDTEEDKIEIKFVIVSSRKACQRKALFDTSTKSHPVCGCSAIKETPCVNCTGIR